MGLPRVAQRRAVAYIDHNVYQFDSRNTDDHRYMQTAARKYGAVFSKPGNGICHQVHMESFSIPGQTLLGTDSHTPLCGAAGMLAIGAGGLDVAVALGGGPYFFPMPAVVRVWLTGRLRPWVTAKDVILELLRRLSVRGGSGKIFEYAGPGLASLLLAQRMTIGTPDQIAKWFEAFSAAGVDYFICRFGALDQFGQVRRFARDVLPRFTIKGGR
jgi:aconitate hydratase